MNPAGIWRTSNIPPSSSSPSLIPAIMPKHSMAAESSQSQETSPPGSIVSGGSPRRKRERVKVAVDQFFDKFRPQHRRRHSIGSASQTSDIEHRDSSRPQSFISISPSRPRPISLSVVPNMASFSSASSSASIFKFGKKRRFSSDSSSAHFQSDSESRHSKEADVFSNDAGYVLNH